MYDGEGADRDFCVARGDAPRLFAAARVALDALAPPIAVRHADPGALRPHPAPAPALPDVDVYKYTQFPARHEHPNSRTRVFSGGRFISLLAGVVKHGLRLWPEERAELPQSIAPAVDASDLHTGAVTWQAYAPFSLVPLWNNQGRADRVIYGGTAAPGQTALCVDPGTQYRCAFPGIDWGEFPYLRSGQDAHTWQGTVMVDKPDATGTYYRRNRSYDPNTARFTQEDPLGLAGGLNVYGFVGGDPVDFSDPFGLYCRQRGNCTQSEGGEADAAENEAWLARDAIVSESPDSKDVALIASVGPEEVAEKEAVVPLVEDSKLGNIVKDLYKGARSPNPIGTGSTADAIRSESATGKPVGGVFHTNKGQQYVRALEKWLSKAIRASDRDRLVARSILDDLKDALSKKQ